MPSGQSRLCSGPLQYGGRISENAAKRHTTLVRLIRISSFSSHFRLDHYFMTQDLVSHFRKSLERRRKSILEWMSKATVDRRSEICCSGEASADIPIIADVEDALDHIHAGDFGRCEICGDDVDLERLELDFTACVCIDHYTESERRQLEADLELAASVQQHLFPCCSPAIDGVDIAAHAAPARIVGGDYFDYFTDAENGQGIAIADVMGKGAAAGLLMASLQSSLRILGPQYAEPHLLATRLNELFRHNLKQIRFISLFLLTLDTASRRVRYSSAGHNPPLWWNASTESIDWLNPTGPAIGLLANAPYHSVERPYTSGDVLVLYTDGVVEARDDQGRLFGEERLASFVRRNHDAPAGRLLSGLWREIQSFSGSGGQDDAALVVVKFT